MAIQTLTRTPIAEHIGIELEGIDLDQPLSEATRQELRDTWIESGLVLLRGALHSAEAHLRLSEVFGEMEPSATSFLNSVQNPFLMELRQTPGNPKSRRYVLNGETRVGYIGWHWDQSFTAEIVRSIESAVSTMIENVEFRGYRNLWLAIEGGSATPEEIEADRISCEAGLGGSTPEDEMQVFPAFVQKIRARMQPWGVTIPMFAHPRLGKI